VPVEALNVSRVGTTGFPICFEQSPVLILERVVGQLELDSTQLYEVMEVVLYSQAFDYLGKMNYYEGLVFLRLLDVDLH